MPDYVVTYNISGYQVYLVKNCKTKKEAIHKVRYDVTGENCEPITFEITDNHWSTIKAIKDKK